MTAPQIVVVSLFAVSLLAFGLNAWFFAEARRGGYGSVGAFVFGYVAVWAGAACMVVALA